MAIVQISKIIHRTGANIDLPQLDPGELGFSTDEQKLFIGNDPDLHDILEGEITTQLEILTAVSNLDFAKVVGSSNTVIDVNSPKIGQLLVADGSSTTLIANAWVNWTGNLLGNGVYHSNNKLHLGNVANLEITGGMEGGVLSTDGAGNLYWTTVTGGGSGDGLPAQNNNSGKYLKTNGTVANWIDIFTDTNFAPTVRSNISVTDTGGDGGLSYSNSTGVITYTGPSASEARAHFSAGTGVTYDSANGQFSIAQDVATDSDVSFNTLTVNNLTNNGLYQEDDNGMALKGVLFNGTANTLQTNVGFNYNSSYNALSVGSISTEGIIESNTAFKLTNLKTKTPTDVGTPGEICWDTNYLYVCTYTDNWEKIEIGSTVAGGGATYSDSDVATYLTTNGYVTGTPWTTEGYITTSALTDYATQTDVSNAVANLVNSAPAALDTLNELATALGNDASYSTTITNSLANKLSTTSFSSTANTWISTQSTSNVSEGTNLYYTDTRANSAIDARVTKSFVDDLGANADHANVADVANTALAVNGANVSGQVGNALVAGTVYTSAQPNITSVGTLANLTVGNSTSDNNIDVFSIVGNVSNLHVSTDESGSISILSKAGQSGTGLYIQDATNKLSFLVGNVSTGNAEEIIRVQEHAMIPAYDNTADLGAIGAAWKSVATRTATLDHDTGALSLFANASGLFATDGTNTYKLDWTLVP